MTEIREKDEFAPRKVENALTAEDIQKAKDEKIAKLKAAKAEDFDNKDS